MLILVTYDVNLTSEGGTRRLRKVARECLNYGRRVQNSVFECVITEAQLVRLKSSICKLIDPDTDNILIYILGKNWQRNVIRIGQSSTYDIDDTLIV